MLGLLGFVLALTLSFGSSRFEERRGRTLTEANAIGTAWLRAEAIGHPRGNEIVRLLEDYARARKEYVLATWDSPSIDQVNQRTSAIQTEIWGHVSVIARERADPVVVSLMSSLNEMFDMSTAARFAHEFSFPTPIILAADRDGAHHHGGARLPTRSQGPEISHSRHAADRSVDSRDRGHSSI